MKWNHEKRKLEDLYPNVKNPRKIGKREAKELKNSIDKFGLCQPIVLSSTGTIIGGHQRVKMLRALGYDSVDVCIPESPLTEKEEEELAIRLNKNLGTWDYDLLANHWEPEELLEWGFSSDELSIDIHALNGTTPDEEVSSPSINITKKGDIYQLGHHSLLCGDCREATAVEKLLTSNKIDMLCTDPPYGVDYAKKTEKIKWSRPCKTTHKNIQSDVGENYRQFFSEFLSLIPWCDKNTAYIFMLGQELHNVRLAMEDCEMKWGDYLVWVKNYHVLGHKDYNSKHEFIVYGWKGTHKFYGTTKSNTILEFDKPQSSKEHPTMKPINLIRRLITDGSAPEANVYDPFCGSGTTLLACEMYPSRKCYGMEIEPSYCDVIIKRWIQYRMEQNLPRVIKRNGEIIDENQFA